MAKRGLITFGILCVAVGGAYATRDSWHPRVQPLMEQWAPRLAPYIGFASADQANAATPTQRQRQQGRGVPVEVGTATRKKVPVTIEALGTVTPIASVAIKSRLETEITGVHFKDGAFVKEGELLFTLDSRALEAQISQAEGVVARDSAQLEGAQRDLKRFQDLLSRNAGTVVNVENAKTQVGMFSGTLQADQSALGNLRIQLSYTKIYSPISGRISAAAVKVGNFVRPADLTPLATVNQTKPVYVTFGLPQRELGRVRAAMQANSTRVEATVAGEGRPSTGRVAMVENTVDATTGMIPVRAIMDNEDEALWPGTLVSVLLTLDVEEAVTVPSVAIQPGQNGTYVFVVKDGAAETRLVKVERSVRGEAVVGEGLSDGETVVLDGHLLLGNGTKVAPRGTGRAQAGS